MKIVKYPLHHVTYAPAKFAKVAKSNGWGDAFARKSKFVLQKPLHQVIYVITKFESLKLLRQKIKREDAFTINKLYNLCPWFRVKVTYNDAHSRVNFKLSWRWEVTKVFHWMLYIKMSVIPWSLWICHDTVSIDATDCEIQDGVHYGRQEYIQGVVIYKVLYWFDVS